MFINSAMRLSGLTVSRLKIIKSNYIRWTIPGLLHNQWQKQGDSGTLEFHQQCAEIYFTRYNYTGIWTLAESWTQTLCLWYRPRHCRRKTKSHIRPFRQIKYFRSRYRFRIIDLQKSGKTNGRTNRCKLQRGRRVLLLVHPSDLLDSNREKTE